MPPTDIRQLRDLMRYRFKLTCFQSSEKTRLQNCLTVSNIRLGNVVSDTFGKSAQAIPDKLLENPADTSFDLEPLVYKSLKKKLSELRDAIDGYITPEQVGKLKVIKAHYESLESRKAELEELILALVTPYQQELAILQPPLPVSVATLLPSESFPKSVPTWRLFLQRNTYAHGLVLLRPTMKVQGRKNLSGFPRPDAISNLYRSSVQMLLLPVKSIRKFTTAISASKSVAVTRKQSLPL